MLSTGITIFAIVLAGLMVAGVLRPLLAGQSEDEESDRRGAAPGGTSQQNRALEVLWSEKQRVLRAIRDLALASTGA